MWFMNGTQSAGVGNIDRMVDRRHGGLRRRSRGDVLWSDTDGNVAVRLMNGAQLLQSAGLGSAHITWSLSETGDFDGDGKSDILWHDTSGNVAIRFMNGTQLKRSAGVANASTTWSIQGANAD
jgi:hypothetical protein